MAAAPLSGGAPAATTQPPFQEPAPAAAPTARQAVTGQWSLLGVGEVEVARQTLTGYAPGELAEIVNLMPRQWQERHERSVQASERQASRDEEHSRSDDQASHSDAANELADTLKESMYTEGLVRNLSNVTPSYGNLNLLLTGSAAEGAGKLKFDSDNVARLVQRMSEQAAQKVADRVNAQRRDVWRQWRERRESQCIDNRGGERLVGVYRWVDRLLRVSLKPRGRHLVLAVQLQSPASAWIAEVLAQGPLPLVKPAPLAAFGTADGQGYALVTPTNYQSWGAQYGLTDLPAPPAQQIAISAQITRVTIADRSLLRVPEGYAVASGSATLAMASTTHGLVASVGGTSLNGPAISAPAGLSVTVPAGSATSVSDPALAPPSASASWLSATSFTGADAVIGLTGAIPITVMSDAPLFGLSVELICQRVTLTDPATNSVVDPLLVQWQMQVYNRLLHAWQDQLRAYDADVAARISAASAAQTAAIQRGVLQAQCLALLSATSATNDPQALTGFFDWTCMSWHYDSPLAGTGPRQTDAQAAPVMTEPASARLFRRFLDADLAWVLIPLRVQTQDAALFALQWQARWPAPPVRRVDGAADVPVAQSTVIALEEQRGDEATPGEPRHAWTLRVPLPLIYLQRGDALPRFGSHAPSASREKP
ncbi:Uncharacterised protein [Bordetella ansorpii]|uniref:Uncharacterized protein n=1 Tax=Bordetella ansorpii TaxID=288768 RepID=A0A157SWR7_9BORD|nr:hypothetical protein [Bordetella ansorpii]SAI74735.1 Uncharacterised protein [Bordetella ansorpii]